MKHLVLGLGSIGKRHAQNLLDSKQEVAGVDPDTNESFNFPVYKNIESGWSSKPEMVWICTPTYLHAKQAIETLDRGCHVFIEKPITSDLESAIDILEVWEKMVEKRMVWVGCNMRFHPAVFKLIDSIKKGLVGKPLVFRIHFSHYLPNMRPGIDYRDTYVSNANQGGGIILDDIHDVDLALHFGGPVKRISGMATNTGTLEMDAEDVAHINILHMNGIFSEIHMDFLRRDKSRGIEVIGERGTLEWRSNGKYPEHAVVKYFQEGLKDAQILWTEEIEDFNQMFIQQLRSVLNTVHEPQEYNTKLYDAIEALKVVLKVKNGAIG